MTSEQLHEAALAALKIERVGPVGENSPPTIRDVLLVTRAFLHLYGGNSTVEQLARAKEWARGADERVSEASDALDAAGIWHAPASREPALHQPHVTIADRIRVLAGQRDAALSAAVGEPLTKHVYLYSPTNGNCQICEQRHAHPIHEVGP